MLKEWGNELDILSHAKTTYREESKGIAFIQEEAWEVLKKDAKWDASKPIELVDLTGHEELFGDDKSKGCSEKSFVKMASTGSRMTIDSS
ncbi:hypothetical protein Tco_0921413 [Tanacetum coccineum]|uniref:Uncharacterized protein n=1 Tax=Tanacetum coccineum TaxID=301880 RepID=A0ABQ5F7Y8_9ASTR